MTVDTHGIKKDSTAGFYRGHGLIGRPILLGVVLLCVLVLGCKLGGDKKKVIKIIDSETIFVLWEPGSLAKMETEERVRIAGIKIHERWSEGNRQAQKDLEEMLKGKEVTVEMDSPGSTARDARGSIICHVFLDGKNVGVEMVRRGYSKYYDSNAKKYADEFKKAEEEAQANAVGIWSDEYKEWQADRAAVFGY